MVVAVKLELVHAYGAKCVEQMAVEIISFHSLLLKGLLQCRVYTIG
jgi:hypothetical protein